MKRFISFCISGGLLALLFYKVDRVQLLGYLRSTHFGWFALALFMFVPQIWLIAWRWRRLVSLFTHVSWREAVQQILASNTMNLILPSKLGDLSKGVFLHRMGRLDLSRAMNIVIFEKMLDVGTLAGVMLIGVCLLLMRGTESQMLRHVAVLGGAMGLLAVAAVALLYFVRLEDLPPFAKFMAWLAARPKLVKVERFFRAAHETIVLLQSRGARRGVICSLSVAIWFAHLIQIYFFFLSLGARPLPPFQFVTMVPLAIFIGLLPLTIAGFGTRDGALIALFPQFDSSLMLGVALYVNLRYILPAIAGMLFLNRYLIYARALAVEKRLSSADSASVGEGEAK
ncbi:MAG: flippase-like domain-containing protein [Candidatus Sumerlaeaceae bacterium]|nr:flippase-like domain-containing protein [Candidatus Sumerlaeaceae bacterium]